MFQRFFESVCHCTRNFAGYMCQECQFGYHGKNCDEKKTLVRRNFLHLSKADQQHFIDLIKLSKVTKSEYVAMYSEQIDPMRGIKFYDINIYDYMVYMHYYSVRNTYLNVTHPCLKDRDSDNSFFSHEGRC